MTHSFAVLPPFLYPTIAQITIQRDHLPVISNRCPQGNSDRETTAHHCPCMPLLCGLDLVGPGIPVLVNFPG